MITDSKSLKKHLQETFKVKFSVRKRGSSLAYRIDWTDGPSEEEVKETVKANGCMVIDPSP